MQYFWTKSILKNKKVNFLTKKAKIKHLDKQCVKCVG